MFDEGLKEGEDDGAESGVDDRGETGAMRFPQTFGGYEISGKLGAGGMGVVYAARQLKPDRPVALKMIKSSELGDELQVRRFFAEATAAGNIDHPGIVPVYEAGEVGGQPYLSMALVEGKNLQEIVYEKGPIAPERAATITRKVAEAVQFGHERGILHRDIKPQNILLDSSDTPRVTDFGLAKFGDADLTISGQIIGTPSFMSPEQAEGHRELVGTRSDVYSIGATLYYLLTGKPPFLSSSITETIRMVVDESPPAPRQFNSEIPKDLETICLKSLNKRADRRYASASDLAADLTRWLERKPIEGRRIGRLERALYWCRRRPGLATALAALVMVMIGGAGLMGYQHLENKKAQAKAHVETTLSAPGAGVPFTFAQLEPLENYAVPLLRQTLTDTPESKIVRRSHAAMALAHFGDVRVDYLVSTVPDIRSDECRNLISALSKDKERSLNRIGEDFDKLDASDKANHRSRARLAILALHLGNTGPFEEMAELNPDPSERIELWMSLRDWHGDLLALAPIARTIEPPSARAALAIGLGRISKEKLPEETEETWRPIFNDWYTDLSDSGLHAAADWAARQWELELPKLAASENPKEETQTYVSQSGLTMVAIAPGDYVRTVTTKSEPFTFRITKSFFISNREVSQGQFQEFQDSPDSAPATTSENPKSNIHASITTDSNDDEVLLPSRGRTWHDAVRFCNWLSTKEGLSEAYQIEGDNVTLRFGSPGYRLPTDSEWEYVMRTGDRREVPPDINIIRESSIHSSYFPAPCGSRIPNRWGVFDLFGNVSEWCHDNWTLVLPDSSVITDPVGPEGTNSKVIRGGYFEQAPIQLAESHRRQASPALDSLRFGFRIARWSPTRSP